MFYFLFFILLLLTNALPRQVDKTQPNNHPHQQPPTPTTTHTNNYPHQQPPTPTTTHTNNHPHQQLPTPTTTHTNNYPHQQPPTPSCLCHVHGLNNMQNTSFGPMVCFFFNFFLILVVLTNVLQCQVDKMQPNDYLHQPSTTPSCLHHVHGLNDAQNASFRPMVCFFFILFISLSPTNVLPCQVNETQPDNDPHQPPPTPFSLRHVLGLNDVQNASFRPIIVFFLYVVFLILYLIDRVVY